MDNNAFFSNIRSELLSLLDKAETEVLIAMAWFTNQELLDAVIRCLRRSVKVKLILLDDIVNHCDFGVDFNKFIQEEGSEFYLYPLSKGFMHNKFCVIDQRTMITGSYNWTNYAESRNLENIVVSTDTSLIEEFISCFNGMLKDLSRSESFEILSIETIPNDVFVRRMTDMAQEVFSAPKSESAGCRTRLNERIVSLKYELPEYIMQEGKEAIPGQNVQASKPEQPCIKPTIINEPTVVVKKVENFKYAVSKYNIGFKANLLDQGGKEGLKVMIAKGQALPFTATLDAQSANPGSADKMNSSCEMYYGDTYDIADCTKFGDPLELTDLPNMGAGEVKFKIVVTLDTSGKLSVKFVCTNTGNGVEGEHTSQDFIVHRIS